MGKGKRPEERRLSKASEAYKGRKDFVLLTNGANAEALKSQYRDLPPKPDLGWSRQSQIGGAWHARAETIKEEQEERVNVALVQQSIRGEAAEAKKQKVLQRLASVRQ